MREAVLTAANLFACDLRHVDFRFADLSRSDMRGACLRGANLSDAKLVDADLRDGVLLKPDARGTLVASGFDTPSTDITTAPAVRAALPNPHISNPSVLHPHLHDNKDR